MASLPPVSVLVASLLSYNPAQSLLGPNALLSPPQNDASYLTGREFFPTLISGPFTQGLSVAFGFAIIVCLIAALASALRGGKNVYTEPVPEYLSLRREARTVQSNCEAQAGRSAGVGIMNSSMKTQENDSLDLTRHNKETPDSKVVRRTDGKYQGTDDPLLGRALLMSKP